MASTSGADLIVQARAGSPEALNVLYDRSAARLLAFIRLRLGPDLRPRNDHVRGDADSPNADVAVGVNADRFWELFLDVLATYR